jgi:hypothetical protein
MRIFLAAVNSFHIKKWFLYSSPQATQFLRKYAKRHTYLKSKPISVTFGGYSWIGHFSDTTEEFSA